MFKSFYKKLIIGAFGEYVENFDDKVIEVSKWEGSFKAENLIIKKDAFKYFAQSMEIPLEIEFGLIKKIELQVEWDKIISSPSYIFINDIHVLCRSKHFYDQRFKDRIKAKVTNEFIEKRFKELCEKVFKEGGGNDPNFAASITWKEKLLKSFTQNINMIIDNVHIRFEENYDSRKFNFGMTIARLEWLNTDKNGDEMFMDYETRKSIGKSFSTARLFRFGVYFNPSSSDVTNFSLNIPNKNDKSLVNYLDASVNDSVTVTKNETILTNVLPLIYQQFYEFSNKILNFSSLEFTNQYFMIEPIDFAVKIRKNLNYQRNDSFPLSSLYVDISEQDLNLKVSDYILNDLIYLNTLKDYHTGSEPYLHCKRNFLKPIYKPVQMGELLRNAIAKVKGNVMRVRFYVDRIQLLRTLNHIQNYKALYFNLLLNQHEYTVIKLSNDELLTCNIDEIPHRFENLKDLNQRFTDVQYHLDEKLVYHLRLVTLIRFKDYLKNIDNTGKSNMIMSIVNYFKKSPSKTHLRQPSGVVLLMDNSEYIEDLINNIPLYTEEVVKAKQRSQYTCIKLSCVNFNIHKVEKDKVLDIMKLQVVNFLLQSHETNIAQKQIFLCDQFFIHDQSIPTTKFRYILTQKKNLTLTNTIRLNSIYDEITYDNDGIVNKLSKEKVKSIENSFIKFYHKKYNRALYSNRLILELQENDIFLNLSFFENLINIFNKSKSEIEIFNKRVQEASNTHDLSEVSTVCDGENLKINKIEFYDVVVKRSRLFLPYNIVTEDYRSFIIELKDFIAKTEGINIISKISELCFSFSPNFLILLNISEHNKVTTIVTPFDVAINKFIRSDHVVDEIYINQDIQVYINKTFVKDLYDLYLIVSKLGLDFSSPDVVEVPANDYSNKSLSDKFLTDNDDEFQEAMEDILEEGSKVILPICIKSKSMVLKSNAFKLYIEDFNSPSNQISLSLFGINYVNRFDYEMGTREQDLDIGHVKIICHYDQSAYYFDLEDDYTRIHISTKKRKIEISYSLDIEFNKVIISKKLLQRIFDNFVYYRGLVNYEHFAAVADDINQVSKRYNVKVAVNNFELDYSDENEYEGLSGAKRGVVVFNCKLDCEKNEDFTVLKASEFKFFESDNKNVLICFKEETQGVVILLNNERTAISMDDINIYLKSSIINNIKDFKAFCNYLSETKNRLIGNADRPAEGDSGKLDLSIRGLLFSLDLFSQNEFKCLAENLKVTTDPVSNRNDISLGSFKLYANSNRADKTETVTLESLCLNTSLNSLTVGVEKDITISLYYYNLQVLKDLHKFYLNLMTNQSIGYREGPSSTMALESLNINIMRVSVLVYDFFLKTNFNEITNNNKLYLRFDMDSLIFNKSPDKLLLKLNLSVGSSSETFVKLRNNPGGYNNSYINTYDEGIIIANDSYLCGEAENNTNVEIKMKGNEVYVDLSTIKIIISEGVISMTKLVRKYLTLFKHLFKELGYLKKSDVSSGSKLNTVLLYLLGLSFFKVQISNFLIKLKRKTSNSTGELVLSQSFNIGFSFDFFFNNEKLERDRLPDFSAQVGNIESYFLTKVQKKRTEVVNDKNYLISPFQVVMISKEEEVNIKVNSIEIDCSMKKISMIKSYLSIFEELSSSTKKTNFVTKSNFKFNYKSINVDIDSITVIVAKEDSHNVKLYELLFCLSLEGINLLYTPEYLKLGSSLKSEYFNSFNESWEPIIEKTHIEVVKNHNLLDLIFNNGINLVFSIQCLKTAKVLQEDINYLDTYITIMKSNELIQNEEDFLQTNDKDDGLVSNTSMSRSNVFSLGRQTMSYKLLNNHLNYDNNAYIRNTYHFQIENLTGEELLLLVDDSSVVKINHYQTIQIEKVLFQLENMKNFGGKITNGRNMSMTSVLSATNSDFKSTLQNKFKQHKEKLNQLKFIKYIYFSIPQLKESFCINLLKNTQEIEIKTNSIYKQIKLLVNIFIDANGRKVVSLKSPIAVKNSFYNHSLEMQLFGKIDTREQQNLLNIILTPNSLTYIPIRYINFSHFRIRPYYGEMNYNQPYTYCGYVQNDHGFLSEGKILSCQMKSDEGAAEVSADNLFKVLCNCVEIKNNILKEFHISFDYTLEIRNYLPINLFLIFSGNVLGRQGSDTTYIRDNLISIDPFTYGRYNAFNPNEVKNVSILSVMKDANSPIDVIKRIMLVRDNSEQIECFGYRLSEHPGRTTSVKMAFQSCGGKLLFIFYVDYIFINDLGEKVDLVIENEKGRTYLHMNSQHIQRKVVQNDPINPVRKISIESDLLSHKSISKTYNNDEYFKKLNPNEIEKSISLHNFTNNGFVDLINAGMNVKEDSTFLELNQRIKSKINNKVSSLAYTENLIKESLKNFNSKNILMNLKENNQNLIQYFSTHENDRVSVKVENSEEVETSITKDVYNVYKNHFINLTYPNKNMIELLCNVKYLDEFFNNDIKELSRTKIIFVENRYQFVNNSGLNLIITQEKCFKDGFYVLHPFEKLNFKWISYSSPLMVKMKINDSNFTKPIRIDNIGEVYLNLRLINKFTNLILKVSIVEHQGKTIVYIDDSTNDPPISVENKTNKVLKVVEKETPFNNIILYPYSTVSFCLNNMTTNKVEILENIEGLEEIYTNDKYTSRLAFNISKLEEQNKMNKKSIIADKGLTFELTKNESMNYVLKIKEEDNIEVSGLVAAAGRTTGKVKYRILSHFIGLSMIDLTPKEIMYLHIKTANINLSVYNKKLYKLKLGCDNIQIDNSIEHQYYDIIFKTLNNQYINNLKALKLVIEFSYNQMGNIMFINKFLFDLKSDVVLNLDGIFIHEIWSFFKNINKLGNEQLNVDEEQRAKGGRIKILTNKVLISKMNVTLSFRPSYKLLKNLTHSQKLLFLVSKIENLQLVFDKYVSQGTTSFETIYTILAKNFMKKYSLIVTKFLLSMDLLFNVSNIFTNFKYGFDSILDSMTLKKNDTFIHLPKKFMIGIIKFIGFILYGINSSVRKFIESIRDITNYYFGGAMAFKLNKNLNEDDLSKKWYLYNVLTEASRAGLARKLYDIKDVYSLYTKSFNRDYKQLMAMNYLFMKRKHKLTVRGAFTYTMKNIFRLAYLPFRVLLLLIDSVSNIFYNNLRNKYKPRKIRPTRYINRISCKIEEYSETIALAYEKLIKNKNSLNTTEDIENYFNFNYNESIIFTNLRLIYCFPNRKDNSIISINLSSIYYFNFEEKKNFAVLKIYYYDEEIGNRMIENVNYKVNRRNNELDDNSFFNISFRKKNHLCLKMISMRSSSKQNKTTLKNIYNTFFKKGVNKTICLNVSY
jgi:hypothetical protein